MKLLKYILYLIILAAAAELLLRLYYKEPPPSIQKLKYRAHHYYCLEANSAPGQFGLSGGLIEEKEKDEIRIALLGGSTTEQLNEQSFLSSLEEVLPGKKISLVNGGIGTYTSAETLIAYLFKVSYLEPDLVILYQAVNDLFPEAYYKKRFPDYRQHRKIWRKPGLISDTLLKASKYSILARAIFDRIYKEDKYDIWNVSLNPLELNNSEALKNINEPGFASYYYKNIDRLSRLIIEEGRKLIIVSFVIDSKGLNDPWLIGVGKMNRMLKEIAEKNKCYFFDLAALYKKEHPLSAFSDKCHFTQKGDNWRIKKLSGYIEDSNILDDKLEIAQNKN